MLHISSSWKKSFRKNISRAYVVQVRSFHKHPRVVVIDSNSKGTSKNVFSRMTFWHRRVEIVVRRRGKRAMMVYRNVAVFRVHSLPRSTVVVESTSLGDHTGETRRGGDRRGR